MTSPPSGIGSWSGYNGSDSEEDVATYTEAALEHTLIEMFDQAFNDAESQHLTSVFEKHKDAVCRIITPGHNSGTGVLIGGDLIITNYHVIPSREIARLSYAVFNYIEEQTPDKTFTRQVQWVFDFNLDEEDGYFFSVPRATDDCGQAVPARVGRLDFTILAIKTAEPGAMAHLASIQRAALQIFQHDLPKTTRALCIIQYPEESNNTIDVRGVRKETRGQLVCTSEYSAYYNA